VRIAGLILNVIGWLIAVSSTQFSGTAAQLITVIIGLVVSLVGIIAVLNRAHLQQATWKGESAGR
jgi:hypothetical protein